MKVLIVDDNLLKEDWGAAHFRTLVDGHPGVIFETRRGPDRDLPRDYSKYDRIIVTGSLARANSQEVWVQELEERIKEWMNAGIPLLGVCHGHQIMARAMTSIANVGSSKTPEVGFTEIEICGDSLLFNGMDKKFYTYSYHFDEVYELPPNTRLLARSRNCEIQAFQHETKPFYAIQFHPEKPLDYLERAYKKYHDKKHLPYFEIKKFSKKYFDPEVKRKIFGNFIRLEQK